MTADDETKDKHTLSFALSFSLFLEVVEMRVFKDALGREWQLSITVIEIKRLRESPCKANLLNAIGEHSGNFFAALESDPVFTVDILTILLADQIQQSGVDERAFAAGLVGEGLARGLDALVKELAHFAGPGRGELVLASWEKVREAQRSAFAVAAERIDQMDITALATKRVNEAFDLAEQQLHA